MGKTETIKRRAIYVYLPSMEMAERWKVLAEAAGTSISKFGLRKQFRRRRPALWVDGDRVWSLKQEAPPFMAE